MGGGTSTWAPGLIKMHDFFKQKLTSKNQTKFTGSQESRGKVPEGLEQAHTK